MTLAHIKQRHHFLLPVIVLLRGYNGVFFYWSSSCSFNHSPCVSTKLVFFEVPKSADRQKPPILQSDALLAL